MHPNEYRKRLRGLPQANYFGDCPICGRYDGYVNIFKEHWFLCTRHRLRWCGGINMLSTWRLETEDVWRRNFDRYLHYLEVVPWRRDAAGETASPPEDSP